MPYLMHFFGDKSQVTRFWVGISVLEIGELAFTFVASPSIPQVDQQLEKLYETQR
jgi:hypothetical protein